MPDAVSPHEAGRRLGASAPTVREMWDRGELAGEQEQHGARTWLRIHVSSIEAYLATRGKFKRSGHTSPTAGKAELSEPTGRRAQTAAQLDQEDVVRQRDDLRAKVVSLQYTVARMRTAAELHRVAERERSSVIEHLRQALAASERADDLRRNAYAELEEAVSAATFPGHAGGLE